MFELEINLYAYMFLNINTCKNDLNYNLLELLKLVTMVTFRRKYFFITNKTDKMNRLKIWIRFVLYLRVG